MLTLASIGIPSIVHYTNRAYDSGVTIPDTPTPVNAVPVKPQSPPAEQVIASDPAVTSKLPLLRPVTPAFDLNRIGVGVARNLTNHWQVMCARVMVKPRIERDRTVFGPYLSDDTNVAREFVIPGHHPYPLGTKIVLAGVLDVNEHDGVVCICLTRCSVLDKE